MKYVVNLLIGFTIMALSACASTPSTQTSATTSEAFPNNCSSQDETNSKLGNGAGPPALAVLGIILAINANAQCEALSNLVPAPDANIKDGVFHSSDGSFSVTLPEPLADTERPGSQVWVDGPAHISKVYITSSQRNGPIYSIYPLSWHPFAKPKTLDDLDERFLTNPYFTASMMIGGVNQEHVFRGTTILPDGSSAVLEVLRPVQPVNAAQGQSGTAPESERPYLLYYLIKSHDSYSILSIVWPNPCNVCSTGPEADIRNMDPRIATFVNSFRRN